MPPAGRVVLVSDDPATAELVGSALEGRALLALVHSCSDLTELAAYLAAEPADAVIIDLGPAPERTLAELDPLTRDFADVCSVVLADSTDNSLVFKAMEAGARYLLPKELISSKLAPVLEKLIPSKVIRPKGEGHIITVLSAGGGCGATTLAVNLADELRVLASFHVLLCHSQKPVAAQAEKAIHLLRPDQKNVGQAVQKTGSGELPAITTKVQHKAHQARGALSAAAADHRTYHRLLLCGRALIHPARPPIRTPECAVPQEEPSQSA